MRFILATDTFPPLNNSGAVQLWDLSLGFVGLGDHISVIVASPEIQSPWFLEEIDGIEVLRVKTPQTKDVSYARRVVGELYMPYAMFKALKKSKLLQEPWDGVIWYSPTIFLGPLIKRLKKICHVRSYLIIRDIFPDWALDLGLLRKGVPYFILKKIAQYQYSTADIIGIQTTGNKKYFLGFEKKKSVKLEVLVNWISSAPNLGCRIDISKTSVAGRLLFVYAGNIGVAQGVDIFLELAIAMRLNKKIGFLFIGRGSHLASLKTIARDNVLENTLFFDEIPSREIPGLYSQCHFGLVALDHRHKSHNIPGKFLTYIRAGLPVLATVNKENDLIDLIKSQNVGEVTDIQSVEALQERAERLISRLISGEDLAKNCRELCEREFSTRQTALKIKSALSQIDIKI